MNILQKIFILVLLLMVNQNIVNAQYQVVSEKLAIENVEQIKDAATKLLYEEVMSFVEGREGAFSLDSENEMIYFKMTEGPHAKKTVRVTRYDLEGSLQVFIKSQQKEQPAHTFILDASEFYKDFIKREKKIESSFFRQHIFSPEPENEKSSRALWIMKREGKVISLISAFNIPYIATDKKDENFPSKTIGELLSMDIADVQPTTDRKKSR